LPGSCQSGGSGSSSFKNHQTGLSFFQVGCATRPLTDAVWASALATQVPFGAACSGVSQIAIVHSTGNDKSHFDIGGRSSGLGWQRGRAAARRRGADKPQLRAKFCRSSAPLLVREGDMALSRPDESGIVYPRSVSPLDGTSTASRRSWRETP
jgi:hypothetical protein